MQLINCELKWVTGLTGRKQEVPFAGLTVSSLVWEMIIFYSSKSNASWKGVTDFLSCILHKVFKPVS